MLVVVIRIVNIVGIPGASEEISLPGDCATLHMNTVDEAVLDVGSTPVAAPDKAAALRELPQEGEIALPGRLSAHYADDVARQAVVVHAHRSKLCSALVEEFLLAILAAVGFIDHDGDSHLLRRGNYALDQFASRGFEQGRVTDTRHGVKARVLRDHIGVKVPRRNTSKDLPRA